MLQFRPPSSDLQGTRSNSSHTDIKRVEWIQVTEHMQGSIRDLGMHETQYTQAFHNGDESGRAVCDGSIGEVGYDNLFVQGFQRRHIFVPKLGAHKRDVYYEDGGAPRFVLQNVREALLQLCNCRCERGTAFFDGCCVDLLESNVGNRGHCMRGCALDCVRRQGWRGACGDP